MIKLSPMPPRPSEHDSGVYALICFSVSVFILGFVVVWIVLS